MSIDDILHDILADPIDPDDDMVGECGICGERYDISAFDRPSLCEVGEFVTADGSDTVVAHAQCGLDYELELA